MSGKAQKRHEQWAVQLQLDRAEMLKLPGFCRVMQAFLEEHGIDRLSFAGEQTHATAFNEGMRNVALSVKHALVIANPNAVAMLQLHAMPTSTSEKDEPDE